MPGSRGSALESSFWVPPLSSPARQELAALHRAGQRRGTRLPPPPLHGLAYDHLQQFLLTFS